MNKKEIIKLYKPKSIKIKSKVDIITTDDNKYVIKKNNRKIKNIFSYLETRTYNNFPKVYSDNDEYDIYEYIEELDIPNEQKLEDMIYLISILHTKTTFYKEEALDDIKNRYETLNNEISNITNYYNELYNIINEEIFMSPSNYYLIRNISKIYESLEYAKYNLDNWYEIVSEHKKIRYSVIHNNLKKDHIIENKDLYLISWNNAKIDMPIYDIYSIYINNYENIDIETILQIYETKYKLLKEEKMLLGTILSIPIKIEFNNNEITKLEQTIKMIKKIENIQDYFFIKTK